MVKQYKQKSTEDKLIDIPLDNNISSLTNNKKQHALNNHMEKNNIENEHIRNSDSMITNIDTNVNICASLNANIGTNSDTPNEDKVFENNNDDQQMNMEITLTNLKIMAQIKKGEKISINEQQIIEIDTRYAQSVRRWFCQNNRQSSVYFLNKVIDTSFKFIDNTYNNKETSTYYFNEESHTILQKFLIEMTNAKKGLGNLKETYTDDITTNSQLDVIIEKITHRIEKIKKILKIGS
jgi:hypothetical protein